MAASRTRRITAGNKNTRHENMAVPQIRRSEKKTRRSEERGEKVTPHGNNVRDCEV